MEGGFHCPRPADRPQTVLCLFIICFSFKKTAAVSPSQARYQPLKVRVRLLMIELKAARGCVYVEFNDIHVGM